MLCTNLHYTQAFPWPSRSAARGTERPRVAACADLCEKLFADVSLRQWLAFTPYELVQANLKIDRSVLAKIPTHKTPLVPG
jgi:hypothetical protein